MKPLIEVQNLRRLFDQVEAVRGISFEIFPGQVVGFIGANGAGKTTTMRMMATLETPTSGTIQIAGLNVVETPSDVRRRIGWMPDNYGTYDHMTVFEYLDFYGRAYGFDHTQRLDRVREVMDFADLKALKDRMINTLSKGMGQRLCFGRTLLHDPEFLILDEPAAGLDPKARVEFKNLVRLLAERGKTIFISSHILSELSEMCDTLLFIDAGQIVHHGSEHHLTRSSTEEIMIDIQVADEIEPLLQWTSFNPGWRVVEKQKQRVRLACQTVDSIAIAEQLRKMILDGIRVVDFHQHQKRLEDAFVEFIKQSEKSSS